MKLIERIKTLATTLLEVLVGIFSQIEKPAEKQTQGEIEERERQTALRDVDTIKNHMGDEL